MGNLLLIREGEELNLNWRRTCDFNAVFACDMIFCFSIGVLSLVLRIYKGTVVVVPLLKRMRC